MGRMTNGTLSDTPLKTIQLLLEQYEVNSLEIKLTEYTMLHFYHIEQISVEYVDGLYKMSFIDKYMNYSASIEVTHIKITTNKEQGVEINEATITINNIDKTLDITTLPPTISLNFIKIEENKNVV